MNPSEKNKFILTLVFISWLLLNLLMLFFHEPWRDELEAWSIAKNSSSISDLFRNSAYEGHPKLWFLILFLTSKFSGSITLAKIIHLSITSVGVWIFLKRFPFQLWLSALCIFGYFFCYEYSVIFRNYGISVTLLFLFCALAPKKQHLLLSVIIFLIAQTNALAFLVGISLWFIYFLHNFKSAGKNFITANFIFLAGIVCFVFSTIPPTDSGIAEGWFQTWDYASKSIATIWDAFIPIPLANIHSWNSNFISSLVPATSVPYVKNTGAVLLIIVCFYNLRHSLKAGLFFLFTCILIGSFISFKYHGSLRHHGFFFIAFLIALWLSKIYPSENKTNFFANLFSGKAISSLLKCSLPALFVFQVVATFLSYYSDLKYPFSNAQAAAEFIQKNFPRQVQITGDFDYETCAVTSYLDKEAFFLNSKRKGKFIVWDDKRDWPMEDTLIARYLKLKYEQGSNRENVILISTKEIKDTSTIKLIKTFPPSIVVDEQFFIYK
ncbi:MAG: hypothetical protein IAF38_21475 [Bacteroidia bacterium]|nr:hypothetical protein [Bacteroidia bacterium]